jgi:hypothetical protein
MRAHRNRTLALESISMGKGALHGSYGSESMGKTFVSVVRVWKSTSIYSCGNKVECD